jgi:hypothetical protein
MKLRSILLVVLLASMSPNAPVPASESVRMPPAGDPVRKAVLDGLRSEVARLHGLEVVFVVGHLRVKDGWAWVGTRPRSRDGASRFEDISALLRLRDGGWQVVEIPCTEVDNPDCLEAPDYFPQLLSRYPGLPVEVLPDRAQRPGSGRH